MKNIKFVEVEYIDKGTFVGSDEKCYMAFEGALTNNFDFVIIRKIDWNYIEKQLFRLSTLEK